MTTGQSDPNVASETPAVERKYAIDFKAIEADGRSAAFIVASRCCWQCQQVIDEQPELSNDLKYLMGQIKSDCSQRADYLLPGTPLTEAIFRLLVATGNKPLSVTQISEQLSAAWASVIYMKDLSEELLTHLLESENDYKIRPVKKK